MTTSADLMRLAEVPEATYAVTPPNPVFHVTRISGESLSFTPTTTTSANMNPQRMVTDSILTGGSSAGAISAELAKEKWLEDLLASAMCNPWAADVLTIGTTLMSVTLEKTIPISDVANDFHRIPGSIMNGFSMTIAPNAPVTISFDVLAQGYETDSAVASGATYVDPVMTPVFTAPLVTDISISGIAASAMCFSNITLTLANNDRALECIGSLGAREMALGRAEVTIAFSLYYADSELLEMLMVQTEFAMAFTLTDSDTPANSYIFEIPRAKLTQCNVVAGGTGQDVMADCVASGLLDTVTGTSLRITRTPGPALADDIDEGEGTLESANLAKESEPGHPEPVPAELLTEAR